MSLTSYKEKTKAICESTPLKRPEIERVNIDRARV
jgi:hypothetical protein